MKKYLVAILMLFGIAHCYGTVSYDSDEHTLTLSGTLTNGEMNDINNGVYADAKNLVITSPTILGQMKFDKLSGIETLVLPGGVTEIPSQEFKNCFKLAEVNWEDLTNLKVIGSEAFMGTAIGPTFYVPNSVEEIRNGAFAMCNSIKTLIFDEGSQIEHIYTNAFKQSENTTGKLSDVYINVKPAREIICDKGAFDKFHTAAQTQVGTVTTRLHYPSELFEYYVGRYKSTLYDQNYDVKDENGDWKKDEHGNRIHSYGIVTQSVIDNAFSQADNGWQQFFSSGIPVGKESLYRTYSDNVAYKVPYTSEFQVYMVVDYDKTSNTATCVQMNYHDVIPANTGIIIHSNVEATVYLEYVKHPHVTEPYDNESYPENLYHLKGNEYYKNYLKPINGVMHIDNVEVVNGKKTYRNYFFNKGTTAASRPGPDWKPEYLNEGWGFFRAVSKDYRVFNKAFLHLPAGMTDASSEHIEDSGNLPQDDAQAQAKESFMMYVVNAEDMVIKCDCGSTTGIGRIGAMKQDAYYTLEGFRVDNPSRGLYIRNGRKVLSK